MRYARERVDAIIVASRGCIAFLTKMVPPRGRFSEIFRHVTPRPSSNRRLPKGCSRLDRSEEAGRGEGPNEIGLDALHDRVLSKIKPLERRFTSALINATIDANGCNVTPVFVSFFSFFSKGIHIPFPAECSRYLPSAVKANRNSRHLFMWVSKRRRERNWITRECICAFLSDIT